MTEQNQDGQSHNLSVFDGGGDGRPVVLISGWPLSHVSWSAQTEALTDAGLPGRGLRPPRVREVRPGRLLRLRRADRRPRERASTTST